MSRLSVNNRPVDFIVSGTGEPLILLHGGQSDHHQFDGFRLLLGNDISAIAYDQRDSPELPYEDGDYGMRDHADDCAAFIKAMGLGRAHLMGTSYGGAVAMMTAIHHPELVNSLILAATTPSWSMFEPRVLQGAASRDAAATERFMLEALITPDAIDNDPALVAEIKAGLCPRKPRALERRMAAIAAHECRDDLGRIRAPTLVLHGDEDPLISPQTATWMAQHIPGAELRLLSGSRHGLTVQHRERTADLTRAFVLAHSRTAL